MKKLEILKRNIERASNNKLKYKGGFNHLRKKAEYYKLVNDASDVVLMREVQNVFMEGYKEQIKNNKEFYDECKINPLKYGSEIKNPEKNGVVKIAKKGFFKRFLEVFKI